MFQIKMVVLSKEATRERKCIHSHATFLGVSFLKDIMQSRNNGKCVVLKSLCRLLSLLED